MTATINNHIVIESGIPVAPKAGEVSVARWREWPFAELQIGQSFFLPGVTGGSAGIRSANASQALRRTFVARKVDGGARVWRVA